MFLISFRLGLGEVEDEIFIKRQENEVWASTNIPLVVPSVKKIQKANLLFGFLRYCIPKFLQLMALAHW